MCTYMFEQSMTTICRCRRCNTAVLYKRTIVLSTTLIGRVVTVTWSRPAPTPQPSKQIQPTVRSFHAAVHPCLARVLTEKHCSFLQDRMIVVLLFSECGTSRNAVTVKSRFCLIRTLSTLPSFTRVCQRSLPLVATIEPFVCGRPPAMTSTHWYATVTKSTNQAILCSILYCV